MKLTLDPIDSPIGTLLVATDERAVRMLHFGDDAGSALRALRRWYGDVETTEGRERLGVRERLAAYFGGDFTAFHDLPLATNGTPFQEKVWKALRKIAPGTTRSYGELAVQIGAPGAARAVGLANGSNPIALIVPCHRVIGADRSLTGFGGGLPRKAWLLRHEGVPFIPEPAPQLGLFA
ncbi:MAG TPA: methylated-DNA--[protein]-cysteine S-methyltransferase [Candidatus Elarobacter sp.]